MFTRFLSKPGVVELNRESAASMVEYAILVMLITLIAVAALRALGGEVSGQYSEIASAVVGASS